MSNFIIAFVGAAVLVYLAMGVIWDGIREVERKRRKARDCIQARPIPADCTRGRA